MPTTSVVIRLRANNDPNGNPRRLYAALGTGEDSDHGRILGVWDEGYSGHNAVPERLRDQARNAPTFDVTTRQYLDLLKEATTA